MAQQIPRKHHRLKTFATLKYYGYKFAGRGIVKDLSQSGSCITGNVPVRAGMVLSLQILCRDSRSHCRSSAPPSCGSRGLSSESTLTVLPSR